jgi:protein phosphatase
MVPADLLNVMSDALSAASDSVRSISESDPELAGSGSTLTAMLLSGSRLALVHIGDSRAYLFRDGGLFQVTHDHSVTQSMIDAGRLTPEEARSHPQRSLLIRAIGAEADLLREAGMPEARAAEATTPDLSLLEARPGDRYLLTSDGLTTVIPVAVIRETLADAALSPEEVVTRLITLANEAGGPDNIALALADITEAA